MRNSKNDIYLYSDNNKQIEIMKTLSLELQKRVESEIVHTTDLLEKELKFSEDLRNNEMVEFYKAHLIKLNNML